MFHHTFCLPQMSEWFFSFPPWNHTERTDLKLSVFPLRAQACKRMTGWADSTMRNKPKRCPGWGEGMEKAFYCVYCICKYRYVCKLCLLATTTRWMSISWSQERKQFQGCEHLILNKVQEGRELTNAGLGFSVILACSSPMSTGKTPFWNQDLSHKPWLRCLWKGGTWRRLC